MGKDKLHQQKDYKPNSISFKKMEKQIYFNLGIPNSKDPNHLFWEIGEFNSAVKSIGGMYVHSTIKSKS